jgi:hypothetical protein
MAGKLMQRRIARGQLGKLGEGMTVERSNMERQLPSPALCISQWKAFRVVNGRLALKLPVSVGSTF